jgi:predicted transcriptional regulator
MPAMDKLNPSLNQGRLPDEFHKNRKRGVMGSAKEEVIRMIQGLPDDCTLEQIQYHLYAREQVERGQADIEAGRVVSHEEAKRKVGRQVER